MRLLAGYKEKNIREDHDLDAFERYSVGEMDADGVLIPHNEPKLVAVKTTKTAQATADPVDIIADIEAWLDISSDEVKNYMLKIWFLYSDEGDSATSDDMAIFLYAGATKKQAITTAEFANNPATRSVGLGQVPAVFHLYTGITKVKIDHVNWAATETHNSYFSVYAYRLPDSIVTEE